MSDIATLGIAIRSHQVREANDNLQRFQGSAAAAERAAMGFERGAQSATASTAKFTAEGDRTIAMLNRMRGVVGVVAAAMTTGAIAGMADRWSELQARVRNAVGEMGNGEAVLDRISVMARRTYSDLGQTAEAWLSNATSLTALGIPLEKQLDLVETLNNSLVVSATRGDRAASVQRAWSNAMALGTLRGDDLNSVLTNSDRLAQALADSLGINVNELRAYGAAGRITRTEMLGVTSQLERLREEADAMPATLADGMTLIRNAILRTVGVLDQAGGMSESFAGKLVDLADNMEYALTVAAGAALVLAANIGGPLVGAQVTAAAAATRHGAALLSGNAILISSRNAAALRATAITQNAVADQNAARSALAAAQADMLRAQNLYAAARAGQVAGVTQVQAHQNLINATRGVSAAQVALAGTSARAASAVVAQTAAMNAATLSARSMHLATTALSGALALVGGPAGAAIIAIGGAMYLAAQSAAEAQERADRYAEAIRRAGDDSNGASGGIREAARALFDLESAATSAENAVSRAVAQSDLAAFGTEMSATIAQLGATMGWASVEMQAELQTLRTAFFNSEMSVEDFIAKVDEIATANPDASPVIAEIQRIARNAGAALGVLDALNAAAAAVGQTAGGKGGRVLQRPPLSDFDFDQRWNAGWGDIGDRLTAANAAMERAARGGGRSGRGGGGRSGQSEAEREAERLTKSYDSIIERANHRIEDLRVEQEALGLTAEQSARLRHETDMLQSAQRSGISLSAAQRAELMGLAAAMASVEAETARMKESIDFAKGSTNGFLSDLRSGLNQGKGLFESFGNAALNVINKIADRMQTKLVDAFFSSGAGGGGGGMFGGILSGIGKLFGFQSGGYTGNGPEGRVAGVVHGREFVVNAAATAQYRPMLEAMNSNRPVAAPAPVSTRASQPEVIDIRLTDDSGRMAGIANRQITTRQGSIVRMSVSESTRVGQKQFPTFEADRTRRTG